jgi:hypothetical protein
MALRPPVTRGLPVRYESLASLHVHFGAGLDLGLDLHGVLLSAAWRALRESPMALRPPVTRGLPVRGSSYEVQVGPAWIFDLIFM